MNHREASKTVWSVRGSNATDQDINIGSLQRIADAVETMSQSWRNLIQERTTFERAFLAKYLVLIENYDFFGL